jgi:hypothetical protein
MRAIITIEKALDDLSTKCKYLRRSFSASAIIKDDITQAIATTPYEIFKYNGFIDFHLYIFQPFNARNAKHKKQAKADRLFAIEAVMIISLTSGSCGIDI